MTAEHYAEAEVLEDGYASVRFVCTGGPEDECHQWCAEGCEETCLGGAIILSGAELELVAQAPALGHRWEPMPPDGSSCRIVDWLDAVGWQDTGWVEEPDAGGEREVTHADLRPGLHRIEEEWTGDDYIWRYPAEDLSRCDPAAGRHADPHRGCVLR